jgi:hypothetical protein
MRPAPRAWLAATHRRRHLGETIGVMVLAALTGAGAAIAWMAWP